MKWTNQLLSFLFIGLLATGCEDKEPTTLNYTDEAGLKQGKWIEYYMPDSTRIKWEAYYEDDEKVGEERHYYQDGVIRKLMTWEADSFGSELHGPHMQFYPNGRFMEVMYYKRGIPDSTQLTYYSNGNIQLRAHYDDGLKVGHWVFYDESGEPFYTVDFEDFQPKWQEEIRSGTFTYLATDSTPAYRTNWLYGSRVADTILNAEAYQQIQDRLPRDEQPLP